MKIARGMLVAAIGALAAVRPAAAQEEPWMKGANWLTLRAGYANSSVADAGHGGAGYGLGYSHLFFNKLAVGGYVHHEMLSRQASAAEIAVPATIEVVRHFDWNSLFRPYLGLGGGGVYRKLYRTGADTHTIEPCFYLTFGGNVPVHPMHLVGADIRILRVDATNDPVNPVFGPGSGEVDPLTGAVSRKSGTHLSVKVAYTITYGSSGR